MAFRRFRRRRPAVVWLPTVGTDTFEGVDFGLQPAGIQDAQQLTTDTMSNFWYELTFDVPTNVGVTQNDRTSLADWEQSAYRLRRIVGKFHAAIAVESQGELPTGSVGPYILGAGFMVRRVDNQAGVALSPPDVLTNNQSQDPWIWRRTWCVSNNNAAVPTSVYDQVNTAAPYGTWDAAGVADGPHIDQKTARIISSEERLFFNVSAYPIFHASGEGITPPSLIFYLDYRILASMRKSTNRRNASR